MLDVIRGKHSTGVASLHKVGEAWEVSVVKDKLNAVDFMDKAEFTQVMAKKNHILMGHNRWATRGAITQENAHPFEFSKIVGAHNGSLTSTYTLFEHNKYPVDSQAAYSEMNENGVESLWGKLDGAAALSWIDKEDNTINFLRNDERPLWYTTINKGKTLVWASEFWMIHVACGRQGFDLDSSPREMPIDQHYKFSLPASTAKKDVMKPVITPVKAYVAPKWTRPYRDYYDSYDSYSYDGEKHYKAEGAKVGDYVEFTVNAENGIKDVINTQTGKVYTTIRGKSLKNTPVTIIGMDAEKYEDLLLEMWEEPDMVFKGKISYSNNDGLVLSVFTTEKCFYTLHDLAAASEEKLPEGVKFHTLAYKVGCSYCRILTNSYYTFPEASICCEECWKEDISKLSPEQRATLVLGYRVKNK